MSGGVFQGPAYGDPGPEETPGVNPLLCYLCHQVVYKRVLNCNPGEIRPTESLVCLPATTPSVPGVSGLFIAEHMAWKRSTGFCSIVQVPFMHIHILCQTILQLSPFG